MLDADRPTEMSEDLFRIATHVVFSGECLRATTGIDDLGAALQRVAGTTQAFLAVPNGPGDVLWLDGQTLRRSPVFPIKAVDTLAAGDVFHGGFTLALAEGRDVVAAMRFAAAAAGIKCTRRGAPRWKRCWRRARPRRPGLNQSASPPTLDWPVQAKTDLGRS